MRGVSLGGSKGVFYLQKLWSNVAKERGVCLAGQGRAELRVAKRYLGDTPRSCGRRESGSLEPTSERLLGGILKLNFEK